MYLWPEIYHPDLAFLGLFTGSALECLKLDLNNLSANVFGASSKQGQRQIHWR